MATFLHLHKDSGASQQKIYRGTYELRSAGFSLWRETGYKGEISSGVKGGEIKAVLEGPGDGLLCRWAFSDSIREDGEIVVMDLHDRMVEKFSFASAAVMSYRIIYDETAEGGFSVEVVFCADEIETDNDLFFGRK